MTKHVDAQQQPHLQDQSTQNTKTPGSLKQLCLDIVNVQMFIEPPSTDNSECVHLLSDVKCDEQIKKFIANQEENLPICLALNVLKKEATSKTDLPTQKGNVNIISNIRVSFEELLLETVK